MFTYVFILKHDAVTVTKSSPAKLEKRRHSRSVCFLLFLYVICSVLYFFVEEG